MNERIKELAKQAEFSEKDLHIQGDNFQRFAELIIKECVGVCTKENWKTLGESVIGLKQFDRGVVSGRKIMSKELCDKIKEHFGVE